MRVRRVALGVRRHAIRNCHSNPQGVYRVKGWSDDPENLDLAYLALKVGGPVLLSAMHKAGMLPSVSWVQQHGQEAAYRCHFGPISASTEEVIAFNWCWCWCWR